MAKPQGEKPIVDNRRARHDYHLTDRVEAGLVLAGTEVKALRDGKSTLQQAYAEIRDGEAWLVGLHIPEYGQGNRANHDPDRPRKLLLHRREIERLYAQVREKGFTLVPTRLYFKDGRVKAEIALAELMRVRLFCDDWEQSSHGGELARAVEEAGLARERVTELPAVLAGQVEGRHDEEEITAFDSTGLAIQDLAIALAALERSGDLDLPQLSV